MKWKKGGLSLPRKRPVAKCSESWCTTVEARKPVCLSVSVSVSGLCLPAWLFFSFFFIPVFSHALPRRGAAAAAPTHARTCCFFCFCVSQGDHGQGFGVLCARRCGGRGSGSCGVLQGGLCFCSFSLRLVSGFWFWLCCGSPTLLFVLPIFLFGLPLVLYAGEVGKSAI